MTLRRPRWPVTLTVILALVLGGLLWAWETDSGYYAYLPDTAHPAANAVHATGGHWRVDLALVTVIAKHIFHEADDKS